MKRMTIRSPRFARGIALAAATAALAVPTAQASVAATANSESLDPWAYNVIHGGAGSTPASGDHSAGRNDLASNGATVTRTGIYGALDPWAYNLIRRSAARIELITEHSAGQNSQHKDGSRAATAPERFAAPSGFEWSDAGIGAASTLAIVLLASAVTVAARKRHGFANARA